jgi:hypothetical protein
VVILGTTCKFTIVHLTKLHFLDGIVGVKGVRGPIGVIIVGAVLDFHFAPDGLVLVLAAPKDSRSSYYWRSGCSVLSCIAGNILPLVASRVGGIVGVVHVIGDRMSCGSQAKRHAGWR